MSLPFIGSRLNADEARALLDSIEIISETVVDGGPRMEQPRLVGLRDHALIAVTVVMNT